MPEEKGRKYRSRLKMKREAQGRNKMGEGIEQGSKEEKKTETRKEHN